VPRNLSYHALILRSRPSGESNRDVWLLSQEAGLLRVTVFGGPKSRLRSYASPFHSGQAWVYHEPVKNTFKLSDFDVNSWRPGLREMYERAIAADAVAETILESHGGGGNWSRALSLAQEALDALAEADEETCARIVLWFLWQWTDFLGLRPEFGACALCGKPAPDRYSVREGGMVCGSCSAGAVGLVEAGPGCCHWLETTRRIPPDQSVRHTLDKKSFREAKALTTAILAEAIGRRLEGWGSI
jgi:DNA repair protein RecO (recombination protein O)